MLGEAGRAVRLVAVDCFDTTGQANEFGQLVAMTLVEAFEDEFDQRCIEETGIMLIPQRCFVGSAEEDGRERTKTLTGGIRLGYGLADFPAVWARFVEFLARH